MLDSQRTQLGQSMFTCTRKLSLLTPWLVLTLGLGCVERLSDGEHASSSDGSSSSGDGSGDESTDSGDASTDSGDESTDSGDESTDSGDESFCGDQICDAMTESCQTCPLDCACTECGDGVCDSSEDCHNCIYDCPCPHCGDGVCDAMESCHACMQDCGECTCPCSDDPNVDNFCLYPPQTTGCPMTDPNGYCDPNGDGSYADGDWSMGYFDYLAQCG